MSGLLLFLMNFPDLLPFPAIIDNPQASDLIAASP
jgi:hypothetical protein